MSRRKRVSQTSAHGAEPPVATAASGESYSPSSASSSCSSVGAAAACAFALALSPSALPLMNGIFSVGISYPPPLTRRRPGWHLGTLITPHNTSIAVMAVMPTLP